MENGICQFLSKKAYDPPTWAAHLHRIPSHIYSLAHLPTPIHRWNLPGLPANTEVYIKRDDLSGVGLCGNKSRKLEFLMAEATSLGADCIITMGGIQSNHCRATAVAAKYLNLDCYLILCTSEAQVATDPGLSGNLLVERLVGAHVELATNEEFLKFGSVTILNVLKEKLVNEGRKPYVIPLGGSNSLGAWGYIQAVREIEQQLQQTESSEAYFDYIVAACGRYCQVLLHELQAGLNTRDLVHIEDAKGLGYSLSTTEELLFIKEVAEATGVILDPTYSGKAAYGLWKDIAKNPTKWEGRKILFVHTGGIFGLYDKTKQMTNMVGKWHRLEIDESVRPKDASDLW